MNEFIHNTEANDLPDGSVVRSVAGTGDFAVREKHAGLWHIPGIDSPFGLGELGEDRYELLHRAPVAQVGDVIRCEQVNHLPAGAILIQTSYEDQVTIVRKRDGKFVWIERNDVVTFGEIHDVGPWVLIYLPEGE